MEFFRNRSKTPTKESQKDQKPINKSASSNQLRYCKDLKLPAHFAEDMLKYEMELEKKVISINIINKVLELYS